MRIWTSAYHPFIMGGDVHQSICTEVSVLDVIDLGKGFKAFVAVAPNGVNFIVEEQSGGIVGDSLEAVRQDVKEGDINFIKEQIASETERGRSARMISPEEFWQSLGAL